MRFLFLLTAVSFVFGSESQSATILRLSSPFTDHAVLQQGKPLPVWGSAPANASVKVEFAGVSATSIADARGQWRVDLPPQVAGGPHRLLVTSGDQKTAIEDVLIGEVWLASGQSNMAWRVIKSSELQEAVASASSSNIRYLSVTLNAQVEPQRQDTAVWQIANPDTAKDFSAVAWNFARHLRPKVNVPIGLIVTAWGGTEIQSWMSRESLQNFPDQVKKHDAERQVYKEYLANLTTITANYQAAMKAWKEAFAAWDARCEAQDPGIAGAWQNPKLEDQDWEKVEIPTDWTLAPLNGFVGTVWFRRKIDIPAQWAGKAVKLELGSINNADIVWFQGHKVGATNVDTPNYWSFLRNYPVSSTIVQAGPATLVVRVDSHGKKGGFRSSPETLRLIGPDATIALQGTWLWKKGRQHSEHPPLAPKAPQVPFNQHTPSSLYNGQVNHLIPYALRGALWYQGEGNAGSASEARLYSALFPTMISDWRQRWGDQFPFYWCQLASFTPAKETPGLLEFWGILRESQTSTLRLPSTGQAVLTDLGDAKNIHPTNKKEVGRRLALIALQQVYGQKDLVFSGPVFSGFSISGSQAIIRFTHAEGSLIAKGGPLRRFAVAGPDKVFHWATATIVGETVVLTSPAVPQPIAVRFACENNPEGANLYNGAGLPACPFRTDDWDQ